MASSDQDAMSCRLMGGEPEPDEKRPLRNDPGAISPARSSLFPEAGAPSGIECSLNGRPTNVH